MQNRLLDLPPRMGRELSALFARDGLQKHWHKVDIVHAIQASKEGLPLDASDDAIYRAGDAAARKCYAIADRVRTVDAILDEIRQVCQRHKVAFPLGEAPAEQIARAVDKSWWIKAIRKEHARRFEHTAIQLGFTNYKAGPYISHESAQRQARRNRQNAKLLASIELQNELGQTYTLAELSNLGTSNKAIRRGELMTRIRGFEEIADSRGDIGIFWTQTAPSKYHAVLSKSGEANPKYIAFGSPTPRDAQDYLVGVWAKQRAALHRAGIRPYGFRIAEPHHDGCPHWHMLLFVDAEHAGKMEQILRDYALEEDFGEWAKEENRAKLVRIEAGKGTAAGYIAKYVAKNIDGEAVGEHHMREDGATYIVAPDVFGNEEITPSQRVTYWSQTWGIRQFQQIGGAPVGVWRELRRIKAETVVSAPAVIQAAWKAAQKTDSDKASWADFVRSYGGVCVGRAGLVQLARRLCMVQGRYATYETGKPAGVFYKNNPNAVYESVRYVWTEVNTRERGGAQPARLGSRAGVGVPWTRVNNCTETGYSEILKNQKFCSAGWVFERSEGEKIEVGRIEPEKLEELRSEKGAGDEKTRRDREVYRERRKNAAAAHLAALRGKYRGNDGG